MTTCAQALGSFAAKLSFEALPTAVVERAKDCIIDTVAVATFGAQEPWSKIADYARRYGSGGPCSIIGVPDARVHAPYAALANGAFAHGFEHDSFRDPSVGAHPGATLVPAVLAACEETGAGGKTAITAFVAGCEAMFRIGGATHHSRIAPETLGFHAPGIVGPYGAAVAAGCVYGLNADQLTHAIGIAGSLSSGLIAFSKAAQGGMVKRLHFGRASESGILAARLAAAGYTGPETVLEGRFGLLEVYCRDGDPARFTAGLGADWETLRIGFKRYAFHMSAQTAVQSLRELMAEHKFRGADVAKVAIEGNERLASHNNIAEPGDLMQAQYSVPFCAALALFRDPEDPKSFDAGALADASIRAACRNVVELSAFTDGGHTSRATRVTVRLRDGREYTRYADTFKGMPANPLDRNELRSRYLTLTAATDAAAAARLFERLANLETQARVALA